MCVKHGVTTSSFSEWKQPMISAIDRKTSHLSAKLTTENNKKKLDLNDKIITEELKMLHMKFVVFSIDSARW